MLGEYEARAQVVRSLCSVSTKPVLSDYEARARRLHSLASVTSQSHGRDFTVSRLRDHSLTVATSQSRDLETAVSFLCIIDDRFDTTNGRTVLIKGFVSSKTGSTFEAAIKFDADYKTVFEFPQNKGGSKKRRSK